MGRDSPVRVDQNHPPFRYLHPCHSNVWPAQYTIFDEHSTQYKLCKWHS